MKRNQKLKLSKKNESKVKKKGNVQSVKSKEREKKNYVILSIRRAHKKAHTGKKKRKQAQLPVTQIPIVCTYVCL